MNILFVTHRTAFQGTGGGETQLINTKQELQSRDHTVDIFSPTKTDISDYDIVHAFSTQPDMLPIINEARSQHIPVVLSPIYIDPVPVIKDTSDYSEFIKYSAKRLSVSAGFDVFDPVAKLCNRADLVIPNSCAEAELLASRYHIADEKIKIVRNGVESCFAEGDDERFFDEYDVDEFILLVCTPSPIKNLHRALPAIGDLEPETIVIGPSDSEYVERCKSTAPSARFIGELPHRSDLLVDAYAAASVFVLPSLYESAGIAALEAGLAGTNLAITNSGGTSEYVGDYAEKFNPTDSTAIRSAVMKALDADETRIKDLRSHIAEKYLWSIVGTQILNVYHSIT